MPAVLCIPVYGAKTRPKKRNVIERILTVKSLRYMKLEKYKILINSKATTITM